MANRLLELEKATPGVNRLASIEQGDEPFIDFTQEPLVDLSKEPVRTFPDIVPFAGADPTSIGPQPTTPTLPRLTASQILENQFPSRDVPRTELVSGPVTIPTPAPPVRPGPARQFQGLADEFIRALGRGSLNVGSGLLSSFADVAVDSLFDAERIEALAETARQAAQSPEFQPATDGGIKGFVLNAVGDALPFMAATIGATLIGGPQAGFGVAYSFEEKSSYEVSYFNLTIYTKFLRKGWLLVVIPGFAIAALGLM
ncbi:hypothetical protein LCGC14_3117370, partial [marine sediment metagenome]